MRLFTIANDGEVKYYKNGKHLRGSFWLTKTTKCLKSSRTTVEVRTPDKNYYIEEYKKGTIDEFLSIMNDVIKTLK